MGAVFVALQQSRRKRALRSGPLQTKRSQQGVRERPSGFGFPRRPAIHQWKVLQWSPVGEILSAVRTGLGSRGQGPYDHTRGVWNVRRPGHDARWNSDVLLGT